MKHILPIETLFVVALYGFTTSAARQNASPASAELVDAKGQTLGTVTFTETPEGVRVRAQLKNLQPHSKHGFHVHQGAVCDAPSFESAGEHFNPDAVAHGGPHESIRHPGDLGNIESDKSGTAKLDRTVKGATLGNGKYSLEGHALILHTKADDMKSQPAGNAGDRLACGVVSGS
jgi:superoxide dismutase, Cu-Zn family